MDTLAERAEQAAAWAQRHRHVLSLVALTALVLCVSGAVWLSRREAARRQLTDAYAGAIALADAPLQADIDAHKKRLQTRQETRAQARATLNERTAEADGGDAASDVEALEAQWLDEEQSDQEELERLARGPKPFADRAQRSEAAEAAFAAVADKAGDKPLGALATLEAAHYASEARRTDAARARLQRLYESMQPHEGLWPMVALRWAAALEDQGEPQRALEVLARFGVGEQSVLADEAGVQRARLLAAQQRFDEARTVLQDVQLRFANTPLTDAIRLALLELPSPTPGSPSDGEANLPARALPAATPREASAPPP